VAGKMIRTRIRWRLQGDMVSKAFFLVVKERPASVAITELHDANKTLHHDSHQIERICTKFYSNLYKAPDHDLDQVRTAEAFLHHFPARFSETMRATLRRLLDEQELREAAKAMATKKSPSPDGLAVEFYGKWSLLPLNGVFDRAAPWPLFFFSSSRRRSTQR
jgi:hypothetical protein